MNLSIDICKELIKPEIHRIVVRHNHGKVAIIVNNRRADLSTTIAYDIGLAIFKAQLDEGEMIVLSINGEKYQLPKPFDKKVAKALLLKAEKADDFQRNIR